MSGLLSLGRKGDLSGVRIRRQGFSGGSAPTPSCVTRDTATLFFKKVQGHIRVGMDFSLERYRFWTMYDLD